MHEGFAMPDDRRVRRWCVLVVVLVVVCACCAAGPGLQAGLGFQGVYAAGAACMILCRCRRLVDLLEIPN